MKKTNIILGLVFLLFVLTQQVFANEAILQLDTKGHVSKIQDVLITKDKTQIVTGSADKTIRVWDIQTGTEIRKILGQIGQGLEGMIFAIALSNDNKYLAVGGYLSYNNNYEYGNIRIYEFKTGKLLKVLKSHSNVVLDLNFSNDGKYLVSGSADYTFKVWKAFDQSFKLAKTFNYHNKQVYAVKIFKQNNDFIIVSAGYDNKIILTSLKKEQKIKTYTHSHKLKYLSVSKDTIAVCGKGNEILIFDRSLNLILKIKSETKPAGLSFSPNQRYLIAGSRSDFSYEMVNIYDTKNSYRKISSFDKHTNSTIAVNFIDNETGVSADGNNFEIYIWNIKTGKVLKEIKGFGKTVWSVGINDHEITFGNVWTGDSHTIGSKFQKSFNLKEFSLSDKTNNFNRIHTDYKEYSLSHTFGGDYGYRDAVLEIKKHDSVIERIVKDAYNGYRHNCYGFYKNMIISGGMNGRLRAYNLDGDEIASFISHTGEVWSIAVHKDRLVSGSDDQTIRIWNLKDLDNGDKNIYPVLNLFVGINDEWIVWSKNGYYNASVTGDRFVGYHINQGPEKEARFVGSDRFFKEKFRPDIIENIVFLGNEQKAVTFAQRNKKVQKIDVVSYLPPVVNLLSKSYIKTDSSFVNIEFEVQSPDSPVTEVIVTLNGRKINTRAIKLKAQKDRNYLRRAIDIELEENENFIEIMAENRFARSDPVIVRAFRKREIKDIYKPNLYVLSIGVSKYKNKDFNLNVADKDAIAIKDIFEAQQGKIYKNVQVKLFVNENATKGNLLDGLDWLNAEATEKDVAIIFIAGHGVNDDNGNFYFLSHEAELDRLRRTAVKFIQFEDVIENLPSKAILLADACHSGNIMGNIRRDMTGAIKSIINSGIGQIIMTATTGNGYSYENQDWGHGAFTKALIEGLGTQIKADYNYDDSVSIKEIDLYVTTRVKELTKGKQKPTTIVPSSVPDFVLVHK